MDVGMLLVFQNWFENVSDEEVFTRELEMGVQAEKYGFDSVWSAEHHFDDYSMCPDNLQIMAYIASRTSRIKLGTGAVILPWNDPLRVVEKVTMLDHMSKGRVLFGMGRGLAKMEYEGFRVDMNESRQRFDEAAEMVIRGLRNGYVENDGPFYKQPRVNVRPGPSGRSWDGRLFGVAMSPDSIPAIANLGVQMMTFMQYDFPSTWRPSSGGAGCTARHTAPSPDRRCCRTSSTATRTPRKPSASPMSTSRSTSCPSSSTTTSRARTGGTRRAMRPTRWAPT
ncbi:LLM class flavin-dependent oxidoreductase [Prauserella oleivorans]